MKTQNIHQPKIIGFRISLGSDTQAFRSLYFNSVSGTRLQAEKYRHSAIVKLCIKEWGTLTASIVSTNDSNFILPQTAGDGQD
jgi:hypothetical protein